MKGRSVFFDEKLTRADEDLMDYAREKRVIPQPFISQPQVFERRVIGFGANTITSEVDVDELL